MSVPKEKAGIRVGPIHCTKARMIIIVITPQFLHLMSDAQSCSALLVMRTHLGSQLMLNQPSAGLRDGRETVNGLVPRVSS